MSNKTKIKIAALFGGIFCGAGLAFGELTNPNKIISFLDLTSGHWDFSLFLFLPPAMVIFSIAYHIIMKKMKTPVFDDQFHLPHATKLRPRIFVGSAIFGIGWGLSGACHGPAVSSAAMFNTESLIYLGALLVSGYIFDLLVKLKIVK